MHEDDAITVEVGVMHEPKASALRNRDRYCIIRVHTVKHALPAKYVLNVLFLVADLKPSRGVETYAPINVMPHYPPCGHNRGYVGI